MKAVGHCAGIMALASTAWVTTTGARLGLRGSIGELGEQWKTLALHFNASKSTLKVGISLQVRLRSCLCLCRMGRKSHSSL